jgi:hypothetical protein
MGMTILEELLRYHPVASEKLRLSEAIPVNVQNVADYYFVQNPKDEWDVLVDFPNIAPPWSRAFYEFTDSPAINHSGTITLIPRERRYRIGLLAEAIEWCEEDFPYVDRARWSILVHGFARSLDTGHLSHWPGELLFFVDTEGNVVSHPQPDGTPGILLVVNEPEERSAHYSDSLLKECHIPLLANCFAHCKNVEITDSVPPPKLSAKQEKRYGVPKLTYKTLNILPMQQVLHHEGGLGQGNSLAKALHICRGHFADYREGPGLFGRYHGLVWRDMHVRGDKKAGKVVKDYEVRTA